MAKLLLSVILHFPLIVIFTQGGNIATKYLTEGRGYENHSQFSNDEPTANHTGNKHPSRNLTYICNASTGIQIVDKNYQKEELPQLHEINKCMASLPASVKKLLNDQQVSPRPCAMIVNISIELVDLISVDSRDNHIMMVMKYRETWRDHKIKVPPQLNPLCKDYVAPESQLLLVPGNLYRKQVWTPDFYMRGAMSARASRLLGKNEALVLHAGNIIESVISLKLIIKCPMEFQAFPFDTQTCNITMESYGFLADQLALEWGSPVKTHSSFPLGGYDTTPKAHPPSLLSSAGSDFGQLVLTVVLKRKTFKYTMLVFTPSIVHFLIAWFSYFLPKEVSQGRSIINCTCTLSLVSMFSIYLRYSPHGGYVKALDIWVFFSVMFQVLCTMDAIIDIHLLYKATNIKRRPSEADQATLSIPANTENWLEKAVYLVGCDDMERSRSLSGTLRDIRRVSEVSELKLWRKRESISRSDIRHQEKKQLREILSPRYYMFIRGVAFYMEHSHYVMLGGYLLFLLLYRLIWV